MKDPEKNSLLKDGPAGKNNMVTNINTHINGLINNGYHDLEGTTIESYQKPIKIFRGESQCDGLTLTWKNLKVSTQVQSKRCLPCRKKKDPLPPKSILKNVSGAVKAGSFLVIMGASGSGKTTLLNCLTQRNLGNLELEGEVLVNGKNIGDSINRISSYIQQDDLFVGTLTVREHLWFNAVLRMGRNVTDAERHARIAEVMVEMGLKKCEDVIIGTPGLDKGLSGGEKKRLAFASELLTRPSIMFCDEPTSGLDSFMAQQVIQSLKNLTKTGRTVLCTIHQPSSEVFAMFDEILMMAEGRVAFMGPTKEMTGFFNDLGYICPMNHNPADFFIYNLAIAPGKEYECREAVKEICDCFDDSSYSRAISYAIEEQELIGDDKFIVEMDTIGNDKRSDKDQNQKKSTALDIKNKSYAASWFSQFRMNFWRSLTDARRNKKVLPARVIQTTIAGILLGAIYWQQNYDMTGVSNINGAFFMLMIQVSFNSAYTVAAAFSREFPVFLKENQDRQYSTSTYYLGKILIDLPVIAFAAILYTTVAYWMIGLYADAGTFFIAMAALVLVAQIAIAYGHLCAALFPNPQLALTLLPFLLGMSLIFSGFLVKDDSIPKIFKPISWVSCYRYAYESLIINQWRDVTYLDCDFTEQAQSMRQSLNVTTNYSSSDHLQSSNWCYPNGLAVIYSYQYDPDNLANCFVINLAIFFAVEFIGYLLLRAKASKKS